MHDRGILEHSFLSTQIRAQARSSDGPTVKS